MNRALVIAIVLVLVSASLGPPSLAAEQMSYEEGLSEYGRELRKLNKKTDAAMLEDIPAAYAHTTGVSLQVEGYKDENGTRWFDCRLVNRSDKPVFFDGYQMNFPQFEVETMKRTGWKRYNEGFSCSTDLYTPEVPPGKSVRFMRMEYPLRPETLRIGIRVSDKPEWRTGMSKAVLWTKPIKITPSLLGGLTQTKGKS